MNQPINTQIKEMLEVVEDIKNTIGLSGAEAFNFYRQAVIGTDKVENKENDLDLLINKFVEHDKKIERLANEMEEFRKLVLDKLDKLDKKESTVDLNKHIWTCNTDSMVGGILDKEYRTANETLGGRPIYETTLGSGGVITSGTISNGTKIGTSNSSLSKITVKNIHEGEKVLPKEIVINIKLDENSEVNELTEVVRKALEVNGISIKR